MVRGGICVNLAVEAEVLELLTGQIFATQNFLVECDY